MHEEGIFRITCAKIKLNKLKAFIDAGLPLEEALVDLYLSVKIRSNEEVSQILN